MTTPAVTVYTTPACPQCMTTKRWLDKRGVTYNTVDLSQSPDDMDAVKALGYSAAPVVVIGGSYDVHWSGFRPDMLAEHTMAAA